MAFRSKLALKKLQVLMNGIKSIITTDFESNYQFNKSFPTIKEVDLFYWLPVKRVISSERLLYLVDLLGYKLVLQKK